MNFDGNITLLVLSMLEENSKSSELIANELVSALPDLLGSFRLARY